MPNISTEYLFQTRELGVSNSGLHLLRSGFCYRVINWNEINSIKIEKGKELHNWWIIFLLGLILFVLGIYLGFQTFDILLSKEHPERYVKMLLFVLIPWIGGYFLYNSLRTGAVLKINFAGYKKQMFPLREIIKANQLLEFKSLVAQKLGKTI